MSHDFFVNLHLVLLKKTGLPQKSQQSEPMIIFWLSEVNVTLILVAE